MYLYIYTTWHVHTYLMCVYMYTIDYKLYISIYIYTYTLMTWCTYWYVHIIDQHINIPPNPQYRGFWGQWPYVNIISNNNCTNMGVWQNESTQKKYSISKTIFPQKNHPFWGIPFGKPIFANRNAPWVEGHVSRPSLHLAPKPSRAAAFLRALW